MVRYRGLFGLWLAGTLACAAQCFTGRVVGVSDGDTLTVLLTNNRPQKIRLAGIDAPEKKQPFGARSKQALSEKVFDRTVCVVSNSTDRYQRWICDIHVGDRWINREMVAEGWAWWYRQYSSSETLAAAERQALENKRGLWTDAAPQPPWEFRRKSKTPRVQAKSTTELDTRDDL